MQIPSCFPTPTPPLVLVPLVPLVPPLVLPLVPLVPLAPPTPGACTFTYATFVPGAKNLWNNYNGTIIMGVAVQV